MSGRFRLVDDITNPAIPLGNRLAFAASGIAELALFFWVLRSFNVETGLPSWVGWVGVLAIGLGIEIWLRPRLLKRKPERTSQVTTDMD